MNAAARRGSAARTRVARADSARGTGFGHCHRVRKRDDLEIGEIAEIVRAERTEIETAFGTCQHEKFLLIEGWTEREDPQRDRVLKAAFSAGDGAL